MLQNLHRISQSLNLALFRIAISVSQTYREYSGMFHAIVVGYTNLFRYRVLDNIDDESVESYLQKKQICGTCPIRGRFLGIPVCSHKKSLNGVHGCGCVLEAKLFSDSPCPLDKF